MAKNKTKKKSLGEVIFKLVANQIEKLPENHWIFDDKKNTDHKESKNTAIVVPSNLSIPALQELDDKIELPENNRDSLESLKNRVTSLEQEIKKSIALSMSMVAVNKELINRLQKKQKTGTATRDTGRVSTKDTSNDILGKIYDFFVKGSERDRRNFEIQKDFEEERALESKKRKTNVKRKPNATATKSNLDKPSTNPILDLLGFISKGVGGILGFISNGLFGIISKGVGGIKDFFLNIPGIRLLGSVLGFFKKLVGEPIKFLWRLIKWGTTLGWKSFKAAWWMAEGALKIGESIGELLWNKFLKKKFEKVATEAAEKAVIKSTEKAVEKGAIKLTDKELTKAGLKLNAAGKVVDAKTGKFVSKEIIEKASSTASKEVIKDVVEKQVAKKIGSSVLKKIPFGVGAAAALWFSAEKAMAGDSTGAKIELASGAAGIIPGVGTVASLAIDLGGIARDVYNETYGTEENKFPFDTDLVLNPEIAAERKNQIMSTLKETVDKYTKNETATKTNESSIPSVTPDTNDIGIPSTLPIQNITGSVTPSTSSVTPSVTPSTSSVTPSVTPVTPTAAPAPSEQREDDSVSVTPDTTRSSMVTISPPPITSLPTLSDMSDNIDVGTTQVVNMPSQSNASYTDNEYTGSPSVRNPNPVVYRTAMRNDQAQL